MFDEEDDEYYDDEEDDEEYEDDDDDGGSTGAILALVAALVLIVLAAVFVALMMLGDDGDPVATGLEGTVEDGNITDTEKPTEAETVEVEDEGLSTFPDFDEELFPNEAPPAAEVREPATPVEMASTRKASTSSSYGDSGSTSRKSYSATSNRDSGRGSSRGSSRDSGGSSNRDSGRGSSRDSGSDSGSITISTGGSTSASARRDPTPDERPEEQPRVMDDEPTPAAQDEQPRVLGEEGSGGSSSGGSAAGMSYERDYLASLGSKASGGGLDTSEVSHLKAVPDNHPNFTRAWATVMKNAESKRDFKGHCAAASEIMIRPENKYHPEWNLEQAKCQLRNGDYGGAVKSVDNTLADAMAMSGSTRVRRTLLAYQIRAKARTRMYDNHAKANAGLGDEGKLNAAIQAWSEYRNYANGVSSDKAFKEAEREIADLQARQEN